MPSIRPIPACIKIRNHWHRKMDVKIEVENGVLSISGERTYHKESKDEDVHRIERSYGRFVRTFTVPVALDTTKVSAKMENGILRIHLPKTEPSQKKAINIQ